MAIDIDLRKYLLGKSAITTLIGTRMFPDQIPQLNRTFPCVTYQIISSLPQMHLTGGAGWCETRVQLDVYAELETERASIAEALRDELQGFPTGSPTTGNMGTATVSSVVPGNGRNLYEPPQDNSDTGLYRHSVDYWLRHSQSVPTYAA